MQMLPENFLETISFLSTHVLERRICLENGYVRVNACVCVFVWEREGEREIVCSWNLKRNQKISKLLNKNAWDDLFQISNFGKKIIKPYLRAEIHQALLSHFSLLAEFIIEKGPVKD